MKNISQWKLDKIQYFENCFLLMIDRKPLDFIIDKINAGSDFDSIEALYDIITEQLQIDYDVEIVPLNKYYDEAVQKHLNSNTSVDKNNTENKLLKENNKTRSIISNKTIPAKIKRLRENTTEDKVQISKKVDIVLFEELFNEKYGCTPVEYILQMTDKGYSKNEISFGYKLRSDSICEKNYLEYVPFSNYYDKAYNYNEESISGNNSLLLNVSICKREMIHTINESSFGKYFYNELNNIFLDNDICGTIQMISSAFNDIEFPENEFDENFKKFKNITLTELFSVYDLTHNQSLLNIVNRVQQLGFSYNSAIVSIYYTVRMMQLFDLPKEKRTVKGLAEAINNLEQ